MSTKSTQDDSTNSSAISGLLVTVYLIVATVATPAMGRLGDLHARRPTLVAEASDDASPLPIRRVTRRA